MGTELKKSRTCTLKIANFSDMKYAMMSDPFSCGGCEWFVVVDPQRCPAHDDNHLSLSLAVFNPKSLRLRWKRTATFCFVILNHSGKELRRAGGRCILFCAENYGWGLDGLLPHTEVVALEKNKLTIQVFVEVVEAVHEAVHQGQSTENDLTLSKYFHPDYPESEYPQILPSQAISVDRLLWQHPDFDAGFVPKYPELRAVYYTLFLSLMETLGKSPQSLPLAELNNAQCQLTELAKAGFKVGFLESKLEVLSLERKKLNNVQLNLKKMAAAIVSPFGFIDFVINRFFLSCFSFSKH